MASIKKKKKEERKRKKHTTVARLIYIHVHGYTILYTIDIDKKKTINNILN